LLTQKWAVDSFWVLAATHLALRKRPTSGQVRSAAYLGRDMVDDTPEQLWQRIVGENPRASDEDIQCLFIAALIDDDDLRLQIIERFFKDMRKRLSN
jgi:hypothetical protein